MSRNLAAAPPLHRSGTLASVISGLILIDRWEKIDCGVHSRAQYQANSRRDVDPRDHERLATFSERFLPKFIEFDDRLNGSHFIDVQISEGAPEGVIRFG
jgi:hypothetical protein